MTSPAPGWYPDPGGVAPFRWWNGQSWTTATTDGTTSPTTQVAAEPAVAATSGSATNPQFGGGAGQFGAAAEPSFGAGGGAESGATTAYGTKSPFSAAGSSNYSEVTSHRSQSDSLFEQNQYAMYTFIAAALSIFFAVATGFVPLIVTPFFTAFASKNKSEQLAPIAFAAAIICGVVGFVTLRDRF